MQLYTISCKLVILLSILIFVFILEQNQSQKVNKRNNGIVSMPEKQPIGPMEKLKVKIDRITKICGEVCETRPEKQTIIGKKWFNIIKKDFNCYSLFGCDDIVAYTFFQKPPLKVPNFLVNDFSYYGQVQIKHDFIDDSRGKMHNLNWTKTMIEDNREKFRNNQLHGGYGISYVNAIYEHLTQHMTIKGHHVLVIGSQNPWLESIILEAGAGKITTLEYMPIQSDHPQVKTIIPKIFAEKFINGTLEQFDVMVTFSSLEHSGLGRYGDGLNPYGDLITMARAWCVLRDGGQALVGVPIGNDQVYFNAHRVYGPVLYSQLFANWEQIYTEADITKFQKKWFKKGGIYHGIHILQKNMNIFQQHYKSS